MVISSTAAASLPQESTSPKFNTLSQSSKSEAVTVAVFPAEVKTDSARPPMGCPWEVGYKVTISSLRNPTAISHVCHATCSPVQQSTPCAGTGVAAASTRGAGPSCANAHDGLRSRPATPGVLGQSSIPQQPRPWAVDTRYQGGVSGMDGALPAKDCAQTPTQQPQFDMTHNVSAARHAQLAANDHYKLPQAPLLERKGVSDADQRRVRNQQFIQSISALVRDAIASGINMQLPSGNLQGMTMVLQGWEQHDRGWNPGAYPEEDLAFDAEYSSFIVRQGSTPVDEPTPSPSNPQLSPRCLGAATNVAATSLGTSSSKAAVGDTARTQLPAGKVGWSGNDLLSGPTRTIWHLGTSR